MRTHADATGPLDGVPVVTLSAALTVFSRSVVLAVDTYSRAILTSTGMSVAIAGNTSSGIRAFVIAIVPRATTLFFKQSI